MPSLELSTARYDGDREPKKPRYVPEDGNRQDHYSRNNACAARPAVTPRVTQDPVGHHDKGNSWQEICENDIGYSN
jgi:hypothetical protein